HPVIRMILLDAHVAREKSTSEVVSRLAEFQLGEVAPHVLWELIDHRPHADEEVHGGVVRQDRIPHLPEEAMTCHTILALAHIGNDLHHPLRVAGEVLEIAGSHPLTGHSNPPKLTAAPRDRS